MLPILAQIPSGLNSSFEQEDMSFPEYVSDIRARIREARVDLDDGNSEIIIDANSPFILTPENYDGKHAALLVHGLFDSPCTMRSIAKYLVNAGILVYSVLLPGHGTIPGDLLEIHYESWVQATKYAIRQIREKCQHLHYVGFSTGGALGIYHGLSGEAIDTFAFFAPIRKLQTKVAIFNQLFGFKRLVSNNEKWMIQEERHDYAKYLSFPTNGIWQVNRLLEKTSVILKEKQLQQPVFMVLTSDDESIEVKHSVDFFEQTKNEKNRLIYYTNEIFETKDKRIEKKSSCYPDQTILDFSHVCLPISPDHPHYGKQGDQQAAVLYAKKNSTHLPTYLGAMKKKAALEYNLQRLSYNPDFEELLEKVLAFIKN